MIWNCFCTESVKGIIDPKSYLRNYLLVSNYIKGYSCMCGVINFRMRNFGQKLKILNVKTETELELASSGIATILGSVGSGLPVSLRHQRGAHCAIVSAGQVFALSAAWTANNAPRRRTLQLQQAAGSRAGVGGTRHLCIASLMWSLVACLTAARWWHTHTHSQHHHRANFTWTNFDTWKCQGIAAEWVYGVRAGARAAGVWRKPYQNVKSNESKVQQRCQCGLWMGMHQQCGGC